MPLQRRIGVNALYLIPGGVGGTEVYLRHLLAALAEIDHRNQYIVFTNRETGDDLCPPAPNFRTAPSIVPGAISPGSPHLGADHPPDPGRPAQGRCPFLPRFLDTGAEPRQQSDRDSRSAAPASAGQLRPLRTLGMGGHGLVSEHGRPTGWLPSQTNSQRDITECYGIPKERISVIRHGVEPAFQQPQERPGVRRIPLAPSRCPRVPLSYSPYRRCTTTKTGSVLLEAYAKLVADGRPEHLVVAGVRGKASNAVRKHLADNQLNDRVHLVGWQPREVLLGLFKFAEALIFPSTFEGFGMPVIEAMAAGLPVACSDIPPLRETADGVAQFFDPQCRPTT